MFNNVFNYSDKNNKLTIIFSTIGFILFIIFLSVLLSNINKNPVATIHIKNLSSVLPNITREEEESIESSLFNAASNNIPTNVIIKQDSATVVQDSYTEEIFDTYTYKTFLVNLDSSDQEYLIQYNDGEKYGGYKINVVCNSSCLNSSNPKSSLINVLPYSNTSSETHWILNKGQYFSPKNFDLVVRIESCVDNFDTNEIASEIKEFLAKYNIIDYKLQKTFSCNIEY